MARNFTSRFVLMAGVLALTASASMAENLRGKIPFEFTVSGKTMPAGTYEVMKTDSVAPIWVLGNLDTKQRAVAVSTSTAPDRAKNERDKPVLTFRCAGEKCALSGLYGTGNVTGVAFPMPANRDPRVQIATVRVTLGD